jgi:hypothetical protein
VFYTPILGGFTNQSQFLKTPTPTLQVSALAELWQPKTPGSLAPPTEDGMWMGCGWDDGTPSSSPHLVGGLEHLFSIYWE